MFLRVALWFFAHFFCSISLYADLHIYSGPTDTTNAIDPAIPSNSARFVGWANAVDLSRSYLAPRGSSAINTSLTGFTSLGDLDATQISNGDSPGYLTVTFGNRIVNGQDADFAVFENGFAFGTAGPGVLGLFADFAYVDVSSNGTDFARFPSVSLHTGAIQGSGAFAGFDVTNVHNLAGKHAAGFGTPFNLDDLTGDPLVTSGLLDLNNVQYVRLYDIPGNGAFKDSLGNSIFDNWLTSGSGGFDFRLAPGLGVGVLNVSAVPEPGTLLLLSCSGVVLHILRRRYL